MSNQKRSVVSEELYNTFAGASWPIYQDYISGADIGDEKIKNEVDEFTKKHTSKNFKVHVLNTNWVTKSKPVDFDHTDSDLEYKRSVSGLPSVKTNINTHCAIPWHLAAVDFKGRVFVCHCYVPFSVGNVKDFSSFDEIFQSSQATLIKESILKKEYKYCATDLCGIKDKINLPNSVTDTEYKLCVQLDNSCNISCPSCRERLIFINDKEIIKERFSWAEQMYQWITNTNKKVSIVLAGGDALASLLYRDVIELFSNAENVSFVIRTNGLLIKNHFNTLKKIISRSDISISIDAATKETYEKVRRGASWDQLIENLKFCQSRSINTQANFVIQKENFKEIIPFVHLCKQYSLVPTFNYVQDWGTWHNFDEQCVHIPTSQYYKEFRQILSDIDSDTICQEFGLSSTLKVSND